MTVFYIDTSSSYLYLGIVKNDDLLISLKEKFDHDLSKFTLPKVVEIFDKVSMSVEDIDKIIVVDGPGSFTGIRIGITIAKVMAWSLNKKITTISSLEAMVISSLGTFEYYVPLIDARRGYVFAGVYDKSLKPILNNSYIKLSTIKERLNYIDDYVVVSNDEFVFKNTVSYNPDIFKIVKYFERKRNINPHLINPNYLKLTEAEENLNNG